MITPIYPRSAHQIHLGDCQNYGPFLGPYYNTGPNLGDPKRDHNFDSPPFGFSSHSSSKPSSHSPETQICRPRADLQVIRAEEGYLRGNLTGWVGCSIARTYFFDLKGHWTLCSSACQSLASCCWCQNPKCSACWPL